MEFGMSQLWFRITRTTFFTFTLPLLLVSFKSNMWAIIKFKLETPRPCRPPFRLQSKTKSFVSSVSAFWGGSNRGTWHVSPKWQAVQLRVSLLHHLFSKGLDSLKTSTWKFEDIDFGGWQNVVVISLGCFLGGFWFALHLWYFDLWYLKSGFL